MVPLNDFLAFSCIVRWLAHVCIDTIFRSFISLRYLERKKIKILNLVKCAVSTKRSKKQRINNFIQNTIKILMKNRITYPSFFGNRIQSTGSSPRSPLE